MSSEWNLAEVKAKLATLGADVSPHAELMSIERPTGLVPLIVLDRVEDVPHPDYCINGFATCVACESFVYLGSQTHRAVASEGIYPICMPCAIKYIPQDHRPTGRLHDHPNHDHG